MGNLFDSFFKNNKDDKFSETIEKGAEQIFKPIKDLGEQFIEKTDIDLNVVAEKLDNPFSDISGDSKDGIPHVKLKDLRDPDQFMKQWDKTFETIVDNEFSNYKYCSHCDTACSREYTVCPVCHQPLPEYTLAEGNICDKCGHGNSFNDKFCKQCGAPLDPYPKIKD